MPIVTFINQQRGMAVIEIEANHCSIIEILDYTDLSEGDEVIGDFHTLGSQTMRHLENNDDINIIVQNIHLTSDHAFKLASFK